MPNLPIIPENITVHLGAPGSFAENVTVNFPDYIKNVASSEIYPTWPENAIRANMYAQVSFALNRIYTEYYRSQGYDFDITNSTAFDQSFVNGRDYFENISQIADELFNDYIVRQGFIEPLFAAYCNGTTTTCQGLSQWGSVDLANQGLTPYQILQRYYGNNIDIVRNAPVGEFEPSEPLRPLQLGFIGNDVRFVQLRLNRIGKNYPSIPKIYPVDGTFNESTLNAVRKFQEIFFLDQDGIVGKATWYKIQYIYNGVKMLNELASEGLQLEEVENPLENDLRLGSTGDGVRILQFFLGFISEYYPTVPYIPVTGVFDEETQNALAAFQEANKLEVTGIANDITWYDLYDSYYGIIETLPTDIVAGTKFPFPGFTIGIGSVNEYVRLIQQYINIVATVYTTITPVEVTGVYGTTTRDAVLEFQRLFGLQQTGYVGLFTWERLSDESVLITEGNLKSEDQFAGNEIN